MFEIKHCDNCNRMLEHGNKVTVILSDVEIIGSYRKNHEGYRLKLSTDGIEVRASKIYCKNCLDINSHFLED